MLANRMKRPRIIQSLDKGLRILEFIAQHESCSLNDIAKHLKFDKSGIFRFLTTFIQNEYVIQNEETKRYRLGFKILKINSYLQEQLLVHRISHPYLMKLVELTSETAHLSVLNGTQTVFIDAVSSSEPISVNMDIGAAEPTYCTALGKVLLAYLDKEKLHETVSEIKFVKYTNRTISNADQLRKHLEMVKAQGYAVDDIEYREGVRCLAAPIFDYQSEVVAAIGISGPEHRISKDKINHLKSILLDIASKISYQMGFAKGTK